MQEINTNRKEVIEDMFDTIYISLNNTIYYLWIAYVMWKLKQV